jgi:hypothetical protein
MLDHDWGSGMSIVHAIPLDGSGTVDATDGRRESESNEFIVPASNEEKPIPLVDAAGGVVEDDCDEGWG